MVAAMHQVDVRAGGGSYPIVIGSDLLSKVDALLDRLTSSPARRIVVSSPTVWRLHGAALPASLRREPAILIPDGEKNKTLATASRIYDGLIRAGADRATTLVAFGGGVIGDVAG